MDYEKKYKEAMERAQKFEEKYGGGYAGLIFPELRESEDERIREFLIDLLSHGTWKKDWPFSPAECVAWLKKQKEQKPEEWSEEDEKRVKQLIYDTEHIRAEYEKRKKELGESFNDELIKDCDEQINWLKSLRPQPHWKPSEEQMQALEYVIRDYREDSCNATANYLQEILDHLKNM